MKQLRISDFGLRNESHEASLKSLSLHGERLGEGWSL